jgi:transposase
VDRQLKQAHRQLDALTVSLVSTAEAEPGQTKKHDVEILISLPGVGTIVLATLLAEAWDALQRRDYAALRSLAGVAPVTRKSGKSCIVVRRQACHDRLANAMYHWARVAVQHDARSRAKYVALRGRGHSHRRALRSVADRLLNVACAMLKNR